MLKTALLHPEILSALGAAGHGARVLVSDGNYPHSSGAPAAARRVFLNLSPGCVTVTDVLAALLTAIPVEAATGMQTRDGQPVPIHADIRAQLGPVALDLLPRHDFYALARGPDTVLVIATGEQRRFGNVLLTIGVVRPPDDPN
jgi:L-fucose mutarotase